MSGGEGPGGAGAEQGASATAAWNAASNLAATAEELDRCLVLVRSSWDDLGVAASMRGVAAWSLREALVVDTEPVEVAVSALRKASDVMDDFARRCRAAESARWQAAITAVATGSAAGAGPAGRANVEATAAESAAAHDASARLTGIAQQSRPDWARRVARRLDFVRRVRGWQAETEVGVLEYLKEGAGAFDALMTFAAQVVADPGDSGDELKASGQVLRETVTDPLGMLADLVDLDTLRTNPARALGHLLPDLLLALTGAGAAAAAVKSGAMRSGLRVLAEREARDQAAAAMRRALIERSRAGVLPRTRRTPRRGWNGDSGLKLDAAQCEVIARYLAESSAAEAALRGRMRKLAESDGGRLDVVDQQLPGVEDHSVKDLDSLQRKVATDLLRRGASASSGKDLLDVLEGQGDTVRYTIVLPVARYTESAIRMAARLDRQAVAPKAWKNEWNGPRYRGINTTWTDVDSGVRFEIQLHTPATSAASKRTHKEYEEWRLPQTPPARKAELGAFIAREFAKAESPPGVQRLVWPDIAPSPVRGLANTPPALGGLLVGGGLVIGLPALHRDTFLETAEPATRGIAVARVPGQGRATLAVPTLR